MCDEAQRVILEDTELTETIQQAIQGDEKAFEVLYEKYISTILYYSKILLDTEEDVYDVAQDVVIKLYTAIRSLKSPYAFYSFMLQVTKNTCISYNRKMRLRRHESLEHAEDLQLDEESMPEAIYEKKELGEHVRESINKLPEKQRLALFMYYYRGLSYKEISKEMGITLQSVGANITRARQALAKLLDTNMAEDESPFKDVALGAAVAKAFVFEMDTSFSAVQMEHLVGMIGEKLAVGAKAASVASVGMGGGISGFFGSASNIIIASVAAASVIASSSAYAYTSWSKSHEVKPVVNDWRPPAQIVLNSAEGNAGQEDPYHARLTIDGAESLRWEVVSTAAVTVLSGTGREIGSELAELSPGDYLIKWTVKNSEEKTVIVKREFSVSPPEIAPEVTDEMAVTVSSDDQFV
jgi:RNA polymerase sigma-70 factor (ECF subfamily)